jgi:hypothetical protein
VGSAGEKGPGFAEGAIALGLAAGEEPERGARAEGGDGEDIPDLFGDDEDAEKVDVSGGVREFTGGAVGGGDLIGVVAAGEEAADLDAEEAAAGVHDEIVLLGVAPGAGDGEAEIDGAGEEAGFRDLTPGLRVRPRAERSCERARHILSNS